MTQLDEATYQQVLVFTEEGKALEDAGDLLAAKAKFVEALKVMPLPHTDFAASTWLYIRIGDIHFKLQAFDRCFKCFWNAVQCPEGLGNPFIHLRLGQMYFEQGNQEKAADELTRAYMGGGLDILLEDDPKYLEFLETQIEI